jgi:sugar O-acyltransferase (sialic acid O-acetyltransferase NeuD family)
MMKTKKAIIFGTGSIAELAHFYLTNDSEYEVVAFTADKQYIEEDGFIDLPLVPFEDVETIYDPGNYEMFIALSYASLNKIRENKYNESKNKGYVLLSYISSKATNFSQSIGDNCFILEDNTIQPFVEIKNNVTLWSGNHLGHHSIIESHNFIASHVVISGHCNIKSNSFIGVNATIRDGITIENENIIGAGSLILKNTKEKEVYAAKKTDIFPRSSDRMKI